MNIILPILVLLAIFNGITLVLLFKLYSDNVAMKIYISQIHDGLGTVVGRISQLEHVVGRIGAAFEEFTNASTKMIDTFMSSKGRALFRTTDGRYTATSLEELLQKIKNDDKESEYFSDDEVNKLRDLFENDEDGEEE